jgi:hypothetical protein
MNKPEDKKEPPKEETPDKGEEKESHESKPSRLAERKGQRPAFPFKRKPI